MKVLVACETSGRVRTAFRKRGHEAFSCDLEPAEDNGEHIICDHELHLFDIITQGRWDLLIAFPPCTRLCVSGARWFKLFQHEQEIALRFVRSLLEAPVLKIALENPVGIISTRIRKPDQIIQPYQFGHPESKKTCLWLKNLPLLKPTKLCEPVWFKNPDGSDYRDKKGKRYSPTHYLAGRGQIARWANQTPSGQNKLPPSPDRSRLRSRTYEGIAEAMADQWGKMLIPQERRE